MKAIQYNDYGTVDVLQFTNIPIPTPTKTQILIEVKAFGVNPLDWKLRRGDMKSFLALEFPVTPGFEAAGIIVALGEDIHDFKIGDHVYGRSMQSYAKFSLIEHNNAQIIPNFLDFNEAASLPANSTTAYSALKGLGNIQKNQHVLIHAGAGGVGINAIQIAKHFGTHVTATASEKNFELLKSLGADVVVDYNKTPLSEIQQHFDFILDSVGGQTQIQSWDLLKADGHMVSLVADLQPQFNQAVHQKKFTFMRGALNDVFPKVHQLISDKQIKPVIDQVFDFENIAQAHLKSQSGHLSGKIVIKA